MNEFRRFKTLLKAALADDLPAQIDAHAEDAGISLEVPEVQTGYADPFVEVNEFPEIRIFEMKKKGYDRELRMNRLGCRMFVVIQSESAEEEVDAMSEAIGDTIEGMVKPGTGSIYDVEDLTIGTFLGPPDNPQKAVGTIEFDVLLNP